MEEQEALQLYEQYSQKYNLKSKDYFLSAMRDPKRAGNLYAYLQQQGEELPYAKEQFFIGEYPEQATTVEEDTQPEVPASQPEDQPASEPPKYNYSWASPSPELKTGNYSVGITDVSKAQIKVQEEKQALKRAAQMAGRKTREEMQSTFADNEIMQRALDAKNTEQAGLVGEFVTQNFQEVPEVMQNFLVDHIYHMDLPKQNEAMGMELGPKNKAKLVEDAVFQELKRLGNNQEIYASRIKLNEAGSEAEHVMALDQYVGRLEGMEALTPETQKELEAARGELAKYEGTDAFKYLQDYKKAQEVQSVYNQVIQLYPEELKRRQGIQDTYESYIKIQPGDTKATKALKQITATAGSMGNAAVDALIGLAKTSKALSDQTQSLAGGDIETYAPSDRAIDAIGDFANEYLRTPINRAEFGLKADNEFQLVKDGEIQPEALLPALGKSVVDMAALLAGARYMGGGNMGLMASGYATTLGNYYEQGKEGGLTDQQALNYAQAQAITTAGLELVGPQNFTRGIKYDDIIKAVKGGELTTTGQIAKEMLREVPEENLQEMAQMFAEAGINQATQQSVQGSRFNGITADQVMETALLTTMTTALVGAARGKSAYQAQIGSALDYAMANKGEFKQELERRIQEGQLDSEEAQSLWEKVLAAEQFKDDPAQAAQQLLDKEPDEVVEDASKGEIVQEKSGDEILDEAAQGELQEAASELEQLANARKAEREQAKEQPEAPPQQTEETPAEGGEVVEGPAKEAEGEGAIEEGTQDFSLPDSNVPAPEGSNRYTRDKIDELFEGAHAPKKGSAPAKEGDIIFIGQKKKGSEEKTVLTKRQLKTRAGRNQATEKFENVEVHRVTKPRTKEDPTRSTEKIGEFSIVPDTYSQQEASEEAGSPESSYTSVKGTSIPVRKKDGEWYRVKKDGSLFKNPVKNQGSIQEAESNLKPAQEATAAPTQQATEQATEPAPQKVEGQITQEELAEPPKAEVEGKRVEPGQQVGKPSEFKEGQVYFRKVKGRDVPYTYKGTRKADGKTYYRFQKQGSKFTDVIDSSDTGFVNEFYESKPDTLQEKIDKFQQELDDARQQVKAAYDSLKTMGAVFDPENEARKADEFFKAVAKYAKAWVKLNATKTYKDFVNSLSPTIREEATDDMLKAAYEGKEWKAPTTQEPGKTGRKKERKAAKRIAEDQDTSEGLAEDIKANSLSYFTEPNKVTDAAAESMLSEMGPEKASRMLRAGNTAIPLNVQVMLGLKLVKIFNKRSKSNKYKDQKDMYLEEAAAIADWVTILGTDLGRGVQAFRAWSLMSPEGVMLWSNRMSTKVKEKTLQRHRKALDNAQAWVAQQRQESAQEVMGKPKQKNQFELFGYSKKDIKSNLSEAKKNLKKALREARGRLSANPFDPKLFEAAGKYGFWLFADGTRDFFVWSNQIRKTFTDLTQSDTSQVWNEFKTPQGFTLAQIADRSRVEDILASPKPSVENLSKTLQDFYGVPKDQADSTAQRLVEEYFEALDKRMKRSNRAKLRKLGIYGKAASALTKMVDEGEPITREAMEEALFAEAGVNFSPEDQKEIQAKAQEMESMPEGVLRDKKAVELVSLIKAKVGENTPVMELARSLWYARILSGPETHMLNAGANMIETASESLITTLYEARRGNVTALGAYWKGLGQGFARGFTEAWEVLATGNAPTKGASKFWEANPLEGQIKTNYPAINKILDSYIGGVYLKATRIVPRMLTAVDTQFYFALHNARAAHYAHIMARERTDLSKREKVEFAQELAFGVNYKDAKAQAAEELKDASFSTDREKRRQVERRARELMLGKPESPKHELYHERMMEQAHRFASRATFNYPPEGLLGAVARGIQMMSSKIPPVQLIVPFTNVVANVLNRQLDYTPVGIMRAIGSIRVGNTHIPLTLSELSEKGFGKELDTTTAKTKEESERLLFKGMMGTLAMAGLLMMGSGEEDDEFEITGKGPSDYKERQQLFEQGWRPNSFRFGNTYISYIYTPMAVPLSIVGNVFDAKKYDKLDDETTLGMFQNAVMSSPERIMEMSFLTGAAEFFEAMSSEKRLPSYIENMAGRVTATNIPIVGSNAVKTVSEFFDPTIYDADGYKEKIIKGMPIIRSFALKPSRNAFGEVVQKEGNPLFDRFGSTTPDIPKEFSLFVKNGVFVPVPGNGTKITVDGEYVKMDHGQLYDYRWAVGGLMKKYVEDNYVFLEQMSKKDFESTITSAYRDLKEYAKAEMEQGKGPEEIIRSL